MTGSPDERTSARPCTHSPGCPPHDAPDHDAARVVARHPEQGWSLLCNGVVVFEDTGEILPDGRCCAPVRVVAGQRRSRRAPGPVPSTA